MLWRSSVTTAASQWGRREPLSFTLSSGSDTWEQSDNVTESRDANSISGYDTTGVWFVVRAISSEPAGAGSLRDNCGLAGVKKDTRGSNAEVGSAAQGTGLTYPGFRVSLIKLLSLERTHFGSEISFGTILSTALNVWLRVIRRSWCCFARSLSRRICAGEFRL